MSRYAISPIADVQGWWEIRDNDAGITCRFAEHQFNETQQISVDDAGEALLRFGSEGLARVVREMADWGVAYHYNLLMPPLEMSDRLRLGLQLAYHRRLKGLTTRQLAEACGVSPSNICKLENGKYNASVDILSRILPHLGCQLDIT